MDAARQAQFSTQVVTGGASVSPQSASPPAPATPPLTTCSQWLAALPEAIAASADEQMHGAHNPCGADAEELSTPPPLHHGRWRDDTSQQCTSRSDATDGGTDRDDMDAVLDSITQEVTAEMVFGACSFSPMLRLASCASESLSGGATCGERRPMNSRDEVGGCVVGSAGAAGQVR